MQNIVTKVRFTFIVKTCSFHVSYYGFHCLSLLQWCIFKQANLTAEPPDIQYLLHPSLCAKLFYHLLKAYKRARVQNLHLLSEDQPSTETHPAPPSLKVNHDGSKWSSALMSAPITVAYLEVGIMWRYITSVLLLEYMCMYFNIYKQLQFLQVLHSEYTKHHINLYQRESTSGMFVLGRQRVCILQGQIQ